MIEQRREFVLLACTEGANISELARRFTISRKTAYKWIARYKAEGQMGLYDRSRCPLQYTRPTPEAMKRLVLKKRKEHPSWGGRKLRRLLQNEREKGILKGVDGISIPAASTITRILSRAGDISPQATEERKQVQRFARATPNELWQMDFKGDVVLADSRISHPLTILDDHSRYNLCLQSCENQRHDTVRKHLEMVFRRYGLPLGILTDNGAPWAHSHGARTRLELWLVRMGIQIHHGRAYHPQTQGKEERFHRTLKTEVLRGRIYPHAMALQEAFRNWRYIYNHERPHEALALETPASQYRISERPYPEHLPAFEYDSGEIIRKVRSTGYFIFRKYSWYIGETLGGEYIALRPRKQDGVYAVCLGAFVVGTINCTEQYSPNNHYRKVQQYHSIRHIASSSVFDETANV